MSNMVTRFLVKSMGFCCPYFYFTKTKNIPAVELEKTLGIHRRTVRYWRQWAREGTLKCDHCKNCQSSELGVSDEATPS